MYGYVSAVLSHKGRQVYTTSTTATVNEAVHLMNDKGVGALLVLHEGRAVGIFTERDVLRRVVDPGRHPSVTRVAAVMTPDPLMVPPSTRVEEAMALMTERRFRHLPIMENNEVIGIISIGDLMRIVSETQRQEIQRMAEYITGAEAIQPAT